MRILFLTTIAAIIVIAPANAQYCCVDYGAQLNDIYEMEQDLHRQEQRLDYSSPYYSEDRDRLQKQERRLQDMESRTREMERINREAETDWIFSGPQRRY
jgi:hypothetical protein